MKQLGLDAIGEGVEFSRIGERVIIYYFAGCKKCRQFTTSGRGEQFVITSWQNMDLYLMVGWPNMYASLHTIL